MAITRERDTQVRSIRELKEELDEFKTAGAKKEEDLNNDQLEAFQVPVVIVRLGFVYTQDFLKAEPKDLGQEQQSVYAQIMHSGSGFEIRLGFCYASPD